MAQTVFDLESKTNRMRVVAGTHTSVAASDAVTISQLTNIRGAVVCLGEDASDDFYKVSCSWSGNVLTIKSWKTDGTDPTPVAATSFSKTVNYFVIGD